MKLTTILDSMRLTALRGMLVGFSVLLAACGGGGGAQFASGGIVGTGSVDVVSVGAISALGAGQVAVNRVRFATAGAAVRLDGQPATEAALKVGMVVTVQGRQLPDGTAAATSIDFRNEVQGVVNGVDNGARTFTLLGQQVRTDPLTVFAGGTFETLVNQYVEVSGFRAAAGDLLATRVEIRSSIPVGASLEITGPVGLLDPVGKTFVIATQVVDYSQIAGAFVPASLANGVVFHVRGTMLTAGGRLVANELEPVGATVSASDVAKVELEGLITEFTGLASFRVNGQLVDGRVATVTGGTVAMLGNGVKVEVEGPLTQGVLVASKIEIEQDSDVVLDGTVDAVDLTGAAVTVGGQRIAVTATTQFEDRSVAAIRNFNLASIRIGDRLSIVATQNTSGLVATRIVRLDPSATGTSGTEGKAEGIVTEFVSVASFKVAGSMVNASSATFEQGVAADLADGRRVEVEGVFSGSVLLATRVVFESSAPAGSASIEGTIANFVSLANFQVAGRTIDATGAQITGGTAADLANGRRVQAEGTLTGGILVASKVSIEDAPTAQALEVEGPITAFVSIANFKVAGQTVDASKAAFTNGTAADLADGRRVAAKGSLVAGVLQATTIEIKDAPEAAETSVKGTITNFVSVANFVVAGRTIDATGATFENGTAADLASGRQVEVEGTLVGAVLRAKKVQFE